METNGKTHAPDELKRMEDLVANVMSLRQDMMNRLIDPRRDIFAECGYPRELDATPEQYRMLFDREPLANKTVKLMPKECWAVLPKIVETEDAKDTEFEAAVAELPQNLRGEQSWYIGKEGNPINEYLERLDTLSGIGHYGIMLIGIDDGLSWDQPAVGVVEVEGGKERLLENGRRTHVSVPRYVTNALRIGAVAKSGEDGNPLGELHGGVTMPAEEADTTVRNAYSKPNSEQFPYASLGTDAMYMGVQLGPKEQLAKQPSKEPRKLVFLRVFDESLVQIVQYEANMLHPRFGLPIMYLVTMNDPREHFTGVGLPSTTVRVHWSRVLHFADGLNSSESIAAPRMRPALNPILDAQKVRGGSAEGYWRGAFPGLSLETHPTLGGDVNLDITGIRAQLQNWSNTLSRFLATTGMSAKMLSPVVSDPRSHLDVLTETICIVLDCPVRVFKGSERGELASQQDDEAWNERKAGRQNKLLTPRLIVPFYNRLIAMGVLPIPPKGFKVVWPDLEALSQKDKVAIALQKVQACSMYISSGVENMLPPVEFWTRVLGLTIEEAESILRAVDKASAETQMPSMAESRARMAAGAVSQAVQQLLTQFTAGALTEDAVELILTSFFMLDEDSAKELIAGARAVPQSEAAPM